MGSSQPSAWQVPYKFGEFGSFVVNSLAEWVQASLRLMDTMEFRIRPSDPEISFASSVEAVQRRIAVARQHLDRVSAELDRAESAVRAYEVQESYRRTADAADRRWRTALEDQRLAHEEARAAEARAARSLALLESQRTSVWSCKWLGRALGLCESALREYALDAQRATEANLRGRDKLIPSNEAVLRTTEDLARLVLRQPEVDREALAARLSGWRSGLEAERYREPIVRQLLPLALNSVRAAAGFAELPRAHTQHLARGLGSCGGSWVAFFADSDYGPERHPFFASDVEIELLPPGDGRLVACVEGGRLRAIGILADGSVRYGARVERTSSSAISSLTVRDESGRLLERQAWSITRAGEIVYAMEFTDPRVATTPIAIEARVADVVR